MVFVNLDHITTLFPSVSIVDLKKETGKKIDKKYAVKHSVLTKRYIKIVFKVPGTKNVRELCLALYHFCMHLPKTFKNMFNYAEFVLLKNFKIILTVTSTPAVCSQDFSFSFVSVTLKIIFFSVQRDS